MSERKNYNKKYKKRRKQSRKELLEKKKIGIVNKIKKKLEMKKRKKQINKIKKSNKSLSPKYIISDKRAISPIKCFPLNIVCIKNPLFF